MVDDKDAVREALADAGIKPLPGPFLDFLDPWGNRIEIVAYDNIQFTKALERAARHGAGASVEERDGDQGAHGQGHGAGLTERPASIACIVHGGSSTQAIKSTRLDSAGRTNEQ